MKSYFFVIYLIIGIATYLLFPEVNAQVEIKSRDMPAAGDTIRWSTAINTTSIQPLIATGSNITIDAQNLIAATQDLIEYKSARQTRYAFFFQNAFGLPNEQFAFLNNLPIPGGFQISNVWDFFSNNATNFSMIGRGLTINGFPAPTYFIDPDEIYQLPLRFGDKDTSTFRYVASVPGGPGYSSTGRRINHVDGWGKVILPIGTFNCIRVHSEIFYNDTIRLPATATPFPLPPIPISYRRIEIKWLAPGVKLPVLQIATLFPPLGPSTTTINYLDINRLPEASFTFEGPSAGCPPITIRFQNHSQKADIFIWDFGDGTTSILRNPTHTYYQAGNKSVRLIARNRLGADTLIVNNVTKVLEFQLEFSALPQRAALKDGKAIIRFLNTSDTHNGNGYQYWWSFGDGGYSNEVSPTYAYTKPGKYSVTLIGIDPLGCKDTLTKENYIEIEAPTTAEESFFSPTFFLKVYPNPAKDVIYIAIQETKLNSAPFEIELYNLQGQLLWKEILNAEVLQKEYALRRKSQWQGTYLLKAKAATYYWIQKVIFNE
ncbi:MAG: PKD domain-containing protein [Bacteroidia bacterium]|nr:PKD domain-containing protein [Bacteroidia bacterium]MDW8157998.1 PKD domain-containing protein [Bacteroidia bacterium]